MSRRPLTAMAIVALSLAAIAADAEGAEAGRDPSAERGQPAERPADVAVGRVRSPAPEGFTEAELETLDALAAETPELADQAAGYISNDDLLTILLVVLIIVIVL